MGYKAVVNDVEVALKRKLSVNTFKYMLWSVYNKTCSVLSLKVWLSKTSLPGVKSSAKTW